MIKKILFAAVAVIMTLTMFAGCSNSGSNTTSSISPKLQKQLDKAIGETKAVNQLNKDVGSDIKIKQTDGNEVLYTCRYKILKKVVVDDNYYYYGKRYYTDANNEEKLDCEFLMLLDGSKIYKAYSSSISGTYTIGEELTNSFDLTASQIDDTALESDSQDAQSAQ